MAGDGADVMAQMQANNLFLLNEDIKALAAAGKSRAQIAAQLTLGPADFISSADALRQGENIAAQIKQAKVLLQNQQTRAAALAYADVISKLNPNSLGSPEDVARMLGTSVSALRDLQGSVGPDFNFMQYIEETRRQNQVFNQYQAGQRATQANMSDLVRRGIASGAITTQEEVDRLMMTDPNTPWDLNPATSTGETMGQQLEQQIKLTGAQGRTQQYVAETAQGFLSRLQPLPELEKYLQSTRLAPREKAAVEQDIFNFESDIALSSGQAADRLDADPTYRNAKARLAASNRITGSDEEEYLRSQFHALPARYGSELRSLAGRPRSAFTPGEAVPTFQTALTRYLAEPEFGTGFGQYKQQKALSKLAPVEGDKGFAPTLTQILTDFGLRSPGTSRNDLLAQNADAIKKTYDEYLRRSSGATPYGELGRQGQQQLLRSGIL